MKKNNTITDSKLVLEYRSGTKVTLTTLVERWHKKFCENAFWIVKDADLAKDIAQESWSTIIDKIDSLHDLNSFGFWALRIVYSKSIDALRNKSNERLKQQEYLKDESSIVEDYKEDNQLRDKLLKTIKDLSSHQQVVIKLFYLEEYSLKEISKTLKISEGTVKSRLFHAREKLKQTIKNKDYEN